MAAPDDVAHAMISYIRENRTEVERLHGLLEKAGVPVWRDLKKLKPGVDWKQEIRTAIRSDAFAFLPCFSRELSEREKSVMWEELTIAVEEFRQRAPGKAWMFPVRLDDTPLPYVNLGGGRTLETLQYVDLFGESYTEAMIELVTAVRAAMGLDSSPTADVTQAVVNEASTERRPALLRETTKKLLLDATHRIQLDDLITGEARRVVRIVDDAKTIEYTGPTENSAMSIAAAEVACHLWREVEPFCWSLQVAVRYTDDVAQLKPWAAALQAMAARATVPRNGYEMLTATRFIPALAATFTGSLAAVSQGNWAALKALTVDATVHAPYQEGSAQPVIELVTPWAPFSSMGDDVQQLLANGETKGKTSPLSRPRSASQEDGAGCSPPLRTGCTPSYVPSSRSSSSTRTATTGRSIGPISCWAWSASTSQASAQHATRTTPGATTPHGLDAPRGALAITSRRRCPTSPRNWTRSRMLGRRCARGSSTAAATMPRRR